MVKTAKESVDMVEPEEANSIVVQKVKEGLSFLEFELQKLLNHFLFVNDSSRYFRG